jgi:uncharacterized protein (TIGR03435 family)
MGIVEEMIRQARKGMSFRVNTLLVVAGPLLFVAGLIALALPSALGQAGVAAAPAVPSPASAEYVPTMTFDVTSVRQNKDVDLRGFTMRCYMTPHTTTFRGTNCRIDTLIWTAYGAMPYQIAGVPDWPFPTFFMVEAKSDSEADAKLAALTKEQQKAEQQHMLQGLLEERFRLKAHWETREGDIYNLVIAKGGPKLGAQGSVPLSAEEKKNYGDQPAPPFSQRYDEHGSAYVAHGCSMDQLVLALKLLFGRPVFDMTGLTGKYDFVLRYKGRWDSDRPADDPDPTLPMDQALQQQIGLKVETAKGPLKVLVIDHIEKPTEN